MSVIEARGLAKKYRCMVDIGEGPLAERDAARGLGYQPVVRRMPSGVTT